MTRGAETEIEMVRRHVREGQKHIIRQREIIASLPPNSDLANAANQLLDLFEKTLEAHLEHLARLSGSDALDS